MGYGRRFVIFGEGESLSNLNRLGVSCIILRQADTTVHSPPNQVSGNLGLAQPDFSPLVTDQREARTLLRGSWWLGRSLGSGGQRGKCIGKSRPALSLQSCGAVGMVSRLGLDPSTPALKARTLAIT